MIGVTASLFSRFDYTFDAGDLMLCQTVGDAADQATAQGTAAADTANLATGCNGAAFTRLSQLDLAGTYADSLMGVQTVGEFMWSTEGGDAYAIAQYDDATRVVVAQNDAGNAENASLWSRFDWHVEGNQTYFCQTVGDAADEATAQAAPAANNADLATGCATAAWTELLRD